MPTLEERVADLEGRMKPDLREEMLRGFEGMRAEMAGMRAEMSRSSELLRDEMTRGFERMEDRSERRFAAADTRYLTLGQKVDRHFVWVVGIQLTVFGLSGFLRSAGRLRSESEMAVGT